MDKLQYEKRTNLYLFLSILFEHDNVLSIHILKQVIQTRLESRSISLPQGEEAKIYLKTYSNISYQSITFNLFQIPLISLV